MQLQLELNETPEPSLLDRFGILIVAVVLLIIAFANWQKKDEVTSETVSSPESISDLTIPRLTLAKLRTYPGFENISDEEGEKVLDTSARISRLICEIIKKQ